MIYLCDLRTYSEISGIYLDDQDLVGYIMAGVNDLQCLGPKMSKEDSTVYNLKVRRLIWIWKFVVTWTKYYAHLIGWKLFIKTQYKHTNLSAVFIS